MNQILLLCCGFEQNALLVTVSEPHIIYMPMKQAANTNINLTSLACISVGFTEIIYLKDHMICFIKLHKQSRHHTDESNTIQIIGKVAVSRTNMLQKVGCIQYLGSSP